LKNFKLVPHSTIKIVTNAFKENKIRNKALTFFLARQENQTPVAIAAIAK
jgi:hypothetical protein